GNRSSFSLDGLGQGFCGSFTAGFCANDGGAGGTSNGLSESAGQAIWAYSNLTFIGTLTTVNNGVAGIVAQPAVLANQTAPLTTTTRIAGVLNKKYRIGINVYCPTSVATATATLTVTYVDSSGTTITVTPAAAACTTLGAASHAEFVDTILSGTGNI